MAGDCETRPVLASLTGRLLSTAIARPEHHAIVTPALTLTYAQLAQLVAVQALELRKHGISADSVVGIHCSDDVRHLILVLATVSIGATSFTMPSHESPAVQRALGQLCSVTDVIDESFCVNLDVAGDAPVRDQHTAGALLLFSTSGTTGQAKLVMHGDNDLVAQAHRHIDDSEERFACLGSIEQNFVKRHRLYCIAAGATNVFPDARLDSLVSQCLQLRVNVLHISAFQAQELLSVPGIEALSGLRLKLGGSLVPTALRQKLRENITRNLQAGYGTTETGAIGFTEPDDRSSGESVGRPLPGIDIQVVAPDRSALRNGERGELAIRCEGMFRGYLGQPELTADTLQDGWFFTGDIGYLDEQRRIHLCGRSDDMFVFNSMNIFPQDLESLIRQHPDVADAAVLPKASPVHGHIPLALVVLENPDRSTLPAVQKFVRQRAGVRSPRQFLAVDKIPRNAAGKIIRNESESLFTRTTAIRQNIIATIGNSQSSRIRPSLAEKFVRGEKDIALKDAGFDSLMRMNLMIMLEVDHDIIVTPEEFSQLRTLGDVAARAASQPNRQLVESAGQVAGANGVNFDSKQGSGPYLLRFFRRVLHHCPTAAQLRKALATLDHRLTPGDVQALHDAYLGNQLIAPNAASKFHDVLAPWFDRLRDMMQQSGKSRPEPYSSNRVAPTVTLFAGPGDTAAKTLLICFAGAGSRQLIVPNPALLQHVDATRFDVLVIAEPLKQGYRLGVPLLGSNITEVVHWLGRQGLIGNYDRVRTLGCSAGGHAAIIAACYLQAELGISVGGRFHSERYPRRILDRVFSVWKAARRGTPPPILACFAADKTRDRNFARIMGWLTGARQVKVELANEEIGHLVFERLLARGELLPFLERTALASLASVL